MALVEGVFTERIKGTLRASILLISVVTLVSIIIITTPSLSKVSQCELINMDTVGMRARTLSLVGTLEC